MTEKTTNTEATSFTDNYKKLSIQIGLNGLSFSIIDTINNSVQLSEIISFKIAVTPYLVLKELKELLNKHKILDKKFSEVQVIHNNDLFSLVPKTLFDENELANYLKFNTKLLANDQIVFDELEGQDMISVYVPFTNINNYIFEKFGAFEYKHNSTVIVNMLSQQKSSAKTICYTYVGKHEIALAVLNQKKILLYNQFQYHTKEDFLYYILFVYERLHLNPEEHKLKLFGNIEEDSDLFEICYKYIKKVKIFIPKNTNYSLAEENDDTIDLTLFN